MNEITDDPLALGEELARRVDEVLVDIEQLPADDMGRGMALTLRDALEDLHREALTRIVRRLRDDEATLAALQELATDPLVRLVLMSHGIMRPPLSHRVATALEEIRPYLRSHRGDVELAGIEGAVVSVRLTGACEGCAASAQTLRDGVAEALSRHVPELERLEVVPSAPEPRLLTISRRPPEG